MVILYFTTIVNPIITLGTYVCIDKFQLYFTYSLY